MTAAIIALSMMLHGQIRVDVQERRIQLSETIRFDHKSATIKKASYKILDALARMLTEKTEIEVLRIEAHNDSLGVASKAMKMSEERAIAVKRYVVSKGVGENRLLAKGYGQEWPIASNWTPAGRKLNRRVDFVLVKVQGREVGRRELPKLFGRVHAIAGAATATSAADEKPRTIELGSAIFPGDRLSVSTDAELTVVFPSLHFVVLSGPTEA
ncbi:MAG: OmpA family protein, partial [Deltaproteobacteria bacterium]|nr:OmpA family protein [Deltaproteobacteria bacterium]